MEENKRCTKCNKVKPVTEFYWRKDRNKYRSTCIQCDKKTHLIWKYNNPNYYTNYQKQNKDVYIKSRKKPVNKAKELTTARLWYKNNKESVLTRKKQWFKNNPIKTKNFRKKADAKRYSIPKNKVSRNVSRYILRAIKGNKSGHHWELLLDYTLQDLMTHLENKFQDNMTWENYGVWHIDHIIPVSLWEFSSYEDREFKQCWALCNLQPLWAIDNIKKGNKV